MMSEKTCEFCRHYDYDRSICFFSESYMGKDMNCEDWER